MDTVSAPTKPFPFSPLGEAVVCKKISTDYTAGGIYKPETQEKGAVCVAQILAIGEPQLSLFGVLMPPPLKVGDTIVMAMEFARKIGDSMRTELVRRGVDDHEIKDIFVAFLPNIMGKFTGEVTNPGYVAPAKIETARASDLRLDLN